MSNRVIASLRPLGKATMRKITQMRWPVGMKRHTQMSTTINVNQSTIEEDVKEAHKWNRYVPCMKLRTKQRKVEVSVYNMRWFVHDDKNFPDFSEFLNQMPNAFFDSDFLLSIDHQYWKHSRLKLIICSFAPFCAYVFLCVNYCYFTLRRPRVACLDENPEGNADTPSIECLTDEQIWTMKAIGIPILVLIFYQIASDVLQIHHKYTKGRIEEYFTIFNLLDISQYLSMITTVILTMLQYDYIDEIRLFAASPALFFIIGKLFVWMALWERIGLYTKMFEASIFDMIPIAVVAVVGLCAFGIPLAVMDFYRV